MKLNTAEVATLQPDFLGFIFYEASPRNFDGEIPELPSAIKKVGVFVDEKIEVVLDLISKHQLNAIQLHGNESPEYCAELKERSNIEIELFKVFSVKDEFDFSRCGIEKRQALRVILMLFGMACERVTKNRFLKLTSVKVLR